MDTQAGLFVSKGGVHMSRMVWWWACIASAVILGGMGITAHPSAWAMEDEDCLTCHGDLSIIEDYGCRFYINPSIFAATTHAEVGCTSCHDSVSDDHPDDGLKPTPVQCGQCHDEVQAEYEKSVHGEHAACTSCHNPHEVKNPITVSGVDENRPCAKCHTPSTTVAEHAIWLPRTRLHMDALPCIACHTGSKDYVIILYIIQETSAAGQNSQETTSSDARANSPTPVGVRPATYNELASITTGKEIQKLVDTNADGFISIRELKRFTRVLKSKGFRLWGMLMPEVVTHSYQILENRWDCSFCHASGPNAMQKSYVALPNKDGSYRREPVEKGAILDTLFGTPNFYMLGASRNRNLTILGLVIVAGGALMPLVHGTLRFLTRRNRRGS